MPVLIVDDDEWDADDIRHLERTASQMTIWKRDGDRRIAELEAGIRKYLGEYDTLATGSSSYRERCREELRKLIKQSIGPVQST